jgi:hypothetical protein
MSITAYTKEYCLKWNKRCAHELMVHTERERTLLLKLSSSLILLAALSVSSNAAFLTKRLLKRSVRSEC